MNQINKTSTKIAILSISLMLMSAPAINGVLPILKEELSIGQTQMEALSTLPNLFVIISILFSSLIAKKIGMKKTVTLGLFLVGFSGSLPLFFGGYKTIVLSRLVLGAGLGLFNSLAVSFISRLYVGDKRASLLGFRSATENVGQAALTLLAGLLLPFGWRYTFAVYLLSFPLIIIFNAFVPETSDQKIKDRTKLENKPKEKIDPTMYILFFFAVLLIMNTSAIIIRFPSIALSIEGDNFNSSKYLALMPFFGIIAGALFGTVNRVLKSKTIYLSLFLLILVNLLVSLSSNHLALLLAALFLSGVPAAWLVPQIFNYIGKIAITETGLNFSTSLFVIGFNLGGLLSPFAMQLIQKVAGTNDLYVPFKFFAVVLCFIILLLLGTAPKQKK